MPETEPTPIKEKGFLTPLNLRYALQRVGFYLGRTSAKLIMELRGSPVVGNESSEVEIYFEKAPTGSTSDAYQHFFLGRKGTALRTRGSVGDTRRNVNYFEIAANHDSTLSLGNLVRNGRILLGVSVDKDETLTSEIQISENTFLGLTAGSTTVLMACKGPNGVTLFSYQNDAGAVPLIFYIKDRILYLGADLEMDAHDAYDIGKTAARVKTLFVEDIVANLPTSNPAVAGQLWNDAGTCKVSAG